MDAFVEAFFAIDTRMKGEITADELKDYMEKHNYADGMVQKWLTIFDADGSGTITLEEFCDTLGLEVKKVRAKYQSSGAKRLPDDIEVIFEDMELDLELLIIDIVREGMRQEKQTDWARYIKQELDAKYERLWHVVIIRGDYWQFVSHEPGYAFNFKLGPYIFLIWRTPGM